MDFYDLYKKRTEARSVSPVNLIFSDKHSVYSKLFGIRYSKPNLAPLSVNTPYIEKPSIITRSPKSKDRILESLKSNHVSNSQGLKIIDLPKLPFGQHISYNESEDFSTNHLISSNSPSSPKMKKLNRFIGLLNKRIKKNSFKTVYRKPKIAQVEIFKTDSGILHCRKNRSVMRIYERETEKFRALNNEMSSKGNLTKKKNKKFELDEIIKRLYVPSVKKGVDLNEKYLQLFDDKVLEL